MKLKKGDKVVCKFDLKLKFITGSVNIIFEVGQIYKIGGLSKIGDKIHQIMIIGRGNRYWFHMDKIDETNYQYYFHHYFITEKDLRKKKLDRINESFM